MTRQLTDEQRERYNANRRRARLVKRRETALAALAEAETDARRIERKYGISSDLEEGDE